MEKSVKTTRTSTCIVLLSAAASAISAFNAHAAASFTEGTRPDGAPAMQVAHAEGMDHSDGTHTHPAPNPLAEHVRQANDRFKDVKKAIAEGYAPIPCVSGPMGGAMGIHYVNGGLLADDAVDLAHPEAVMYEPEPNGSLRLVAVEYITSKGPADLEGHLFNFSGAPNRYGLGPFYSLHVWAWRQNPTGTFADMNPTVSCNAVGAK